MYSRDFGGIKSDGQLYDLEREYNESRRQNPPPNEGYKESNNETESDKGYITVNGGTLNISAAEDGIQAVNTLTVKDGSVSNDNDTAEHGLIFHIKER